MSYSRTSSSLVKKRNLNTERYVSSFCSK